VITAILILVIFIAGSVSALYIWQRAPRNKDDKALPPPPEFRGLFDDKPSEDQQRLAAKEDASFRRDALRANLLERAALNDLGALDEADSAADRDLYNEVLDEIVYRAAASHESLGPLVTHITESKKLRSNARLARALIESLTRTTDRRAIAEALHVAALSDDAAVYEQAVEKVVDLWQAGQSNDMTAKELLALVESQYWLLSADARRAGEGFALRQTLERCRRQLAQRARAQ
jgi:hypothetical protein